MAGDARTRSIRRPYGWAPLSLIVVFGLRRIAPACPGGPGAGGRWAAGLVAARPRRARRGAGRCRAARAALARTSGPASSCGITPAPSAVAAVALVLIGFSQTAGDARAFAAKHRYQIDIDQESLAQAMANTGAGLLQGMPVSTSLSASSLNDHSGARTGLASITSGVTVLLTLLFLAPLFSNLPKPVLAALIIEAVVMGMMNVPEMRRLARVQRFDFWIAIAAILGTLALRRSRRRRDRDRSVPALADLGRHPPQDADPRPRARHPGLPRTGPSIPTTNRFPGWSALRVDGGLFFATSDALEDRIREVIHSTPGLTGIVLDFGGIDFIDSQGSAKLGDVVHLTNESGITLRLAGVKPDVSATLGKRRHPRPYRDRQDPRQRPPSCPGATRHLGGPTRRPVTSSLLLDVVVDVWHNEFTRPGSVSPHAPQTERRWRHDNSKR